jgi:hypothetical protein
MGPCKQRHTDCMHPLQCTDRQSKIVLAWLLEEQQELREFL